MPRTYTLLYVNYILVKLEKIFMLPSYFLADFNRNVFELNFLKFSIIEKMFMLYNVQLTF